MELSDDDRARLRLFRAAARQVRFSSLIDAYRPNDFWISGKRDRDGKETTEAVLLESEPFRSLAASLRLAYQDREAGQFYAIAKLMTRVSGESDRLTVARIRKRFSQALGESIGSTTVKIDGVKVKLSAKEVLDTWMYCGVFHQDPERQATYDALQRRPEWFLFNVQITALTLGWCILSLDDVVADVLGEPRLPRLNSVEDDSGNEETDDA